MEECSCESEVEEEREVEGGCLHSNTLMTYWSMKARSAQTKSSKDMEEEKLSTMDLSDVDYTESIQLFSKNPKAEINKRMREVENSKELTTDTDKKTAIKKLLEQYLVDYETFCFEEAWDSLDGSLTATIRTINAGLEQTFAKRIGGIPFEWRRVKLLKYLEKK